MTSQTRRLLCLVWVTTSAAMAAPFKFDSLTITVPDGLEIERIAGPPLVDRPISMAFDDRGRLYVTDSAGMSDGAEKQLLAKAHRLLRIEDTDGDGRFDRQTVFADKLMFPEGCLVHEGSVYVAAPPEIWKFTDADDDGVAEKREVWFDGRTLTHCGNDLHGPYLGRDGWFYWAKGAYAEQHYTLPDGRPFRTRAAHIFRARPDATQIEPVLTGGMDNPVGVAFTRTGERILSGTFFWTPAAGQRDGLIHAIYGGVYGKTRDTIFDHVMTGDIMPNLTQMGAAAPCGIICCGTDLLGTGFRDNILTCYFNLHKVVRHELIPDGPTFKTREIDFAKSDSPDFHPTDVLEDADGSMLIADTGGWYKVCCPTSQLAKPDVLGAIYRVRRTGMPRVEDPRGLKIAWDELKPADLLPLLDDSRLHVQQRAVRELAHQGDAAVPALAGLLARPGSLIARQNATWALSRIDSREARAATRLALRDDHPAVAHAGLHVTAAWRDREALEPAAALLSRGNPAVARAAAEALGRMRDRRAVPALLAAVEKLGAAQPGESGAPADAAARIMEHSIIYALVEIGDVESLLASLDSAGVRSRRAALVALDQMKQGALQAAAVMHLMRHDHDMLRLTAAWIAGHHPEWGGMLAGHFKERLAQPPAKGAARLALEKQIAKLAGSPDIQSLLAGVLNDGGDAGRLVALHAMAMAGVKTAPLTWLDALAALLPKAGADVLPDCVATARALPLPKGGHGPLTAALAQIGRRDDLPAQVRLDALAIVRSPGRVEPSLFDFLLRQVAVDQPLPARTAAADVLAKANLGADQQLALADALHTVGPLEAPRLLYAFERNPSEALGFRVVSALTNSAGLRGLRADLLKPLFDKYPRPVQDAGQLLIKTLNADAEKQAAHLDDFVAHLPAGDLRRGQAVFIRGGCQVCHTIGYQGGRLGPDITNIGKVRTARDLIEAIVYPSASIVRGYETFTVSTKSGETYSGTLNRDAADEVVLNIAPLVQQRIARADIAQINPVPISLMPLGFGDLLPRQDLSDLVEFLRASRR